MSVLTELKKGRFLIGVIHVPPFPTSLQRDRWVMEDIVSYCIDSAHKMEAAGFSSVLIQNVGDEPTHLEAPPETIANMSAVGREVRKSIGIPLGICLLDHDGKAPIAVAQACGADYIRIKTYVGTMVKMTGTLQGVYHQAVQYRRNIRAEHIDIFADIFDREGYPIGATDLGEMAHFAEYCCMADALIITGRSFEGTQDMLRTVARNVSLPLLVGGGINPGNIAQVTDLAHGFVIGNCLKVDQDNDYSPISAIRCRELVAETTVYQDL